MAGNTDGLDFSICRIQLQTLEMQFSGAFQPVFIASQGQITELKADKMPISVNRNERAFTVQHHQLMRGDLIYFSTDGYYDQFGDGNIGKITKGKLKSLLEEIHNQSLGQQREVLDNYFTHWKGTQEQTDDVTVLGIMI
jgi:serine phosphatase RsbU (regulator of sigma subunit)